MDINDLYTIGIVVAVTGIALAFALQVTGDVKDDMDEDSCQAQTDGSWNNTDCVNASNTTQSVTYPLTAQSNASLDAIDGIAVVPEKLPTVATIGVAVVIIGLLAGFFVMRR